MHFIKYDTKYTPQTLIATQEDLSGRINMLWHNGFWDGPLSGPVTLDDKRGYYVQCVDDRWNMHFGEADESCTGELMRVGCKEYKDDGLCCIEEWDRFYSVYKMTTWQFFIELFLHTWFRTFVGGHTEYDASGGCDHNKVKPRSLHKWFYNWPKPKRVRLKATQLVGYTTLLFQCND